MQAKQTVIVRAKTPVSPIKASDGIPNEHGKPLENVSNMSIAHIDHDGGVSAPFHPH